MLIRLFCTIVFNPPSTIVNVSGQQDRFKLWTNAGKLVNAILNNQSLYQTACLGYNEEEDKNTNLYLIRVMFSLLNLVENL